MSKFAIEVRLLARAHAPRIGYDSYGNMCGCGGGIQDQLSYDAYLAVRSTRKQLEDLRKTALRRMDMNLLKGIDFTLAALKEPQP